MGNSKKFSETRATSTYHKRMDRERIRSLSNPDLISIIESSSKDYPVLINCTPHPIKLIKKGMFVGTIEQSRHIARLDIRSVDVMTEQGILIQDVQEIDVIDLPEPIENVYYIVSHRVGKYVKRSDLIVPIIERAGENDESSLGTVGFHNCRNVNIRYFTSNDIDEEPYKIEIVEEEEVSDSIDD